MVLYYYDQSETMNQQKAQVASQIEYIKDQLAHATTIATTVEGETDYMSRVAQLEEEGKTLTAMISAAEKQVQGLKEKHFKLIKKQEQQLVVLTGLATENEATFNEACDRVDQLTAQYPLECDLRKKFFGNIKKGEKHFALLCEMVAVHLEKMTVEADEDIDLGQFCVEVNEVVVKTGMLKRKRGLEMDSCIDMMNVSSKFVKMNDIECKPVKLEHCVLEPLFSSDEEDLLDDAKEYHLKNEDEDEELEEDDDEEVIYDEEEVNGEGEGEH